jgi:prepilin-type N-terminal cleavage/methylation domain-containing protein
VLLWLQFIVTLVILKNKNRMVKMKKQPACAGKQGFTLMELLIVIVILVLLAIGLLLALRNQIMKGNDMKRKTDLGKIQKVLEEYYNDKATYPLTSPIVNCGGADLKPYLEKVPCDPTKKTPYLYIPGVPTPRNGYVLCAKLENGSDSDITRIGCHPVNGCGWAPGYNYCVAIGAPVIKPGYDPNAGGEGAANGATSTPTPQPGQYACTPGGECNVYADPAAAGCVFTYGDSGCIYNGVYQCANPANRCTNY